MGGADRAGMFPLFWLIGGHRSLCCATALTMGDQQKSDDNLMLTLFSLGGKAKPLKVRPFV